MFEGDTDWDLESDVQSTIEEELAAKGITFKEAEFGELLSRMHSSRTQTNEYAMSPETIEPTLTTALVMKSSTSSF
jgi:hypothetical protein